MASRGGGDGSAPSARSLAVAEDGQIVVTPQYGGTLNIGTVYVGLSALSFDPYDWNWKVNHDAGMVYELLFAADLDQSVSRGGRYSFQSEGLAATRRDARRARRELGVGGPAHAGRAPAARRALHRQARRHGGARARRARTWCGATSASPRARRLRRATTTTSSASRRATRTRWSTASRSSIPSGICAAGTATTRRSCRARWPRSTRATGATWSAPGRSSSPASSRAAPRPISAIPTTGIARRSAARPTRFPSSTR